MSLGTDPINIFPKNCSEDDIDWGLPSFPSFFTVEMPRRFLSFLYAVFNLIKLDLQSIGKSLDS